MVSHLINRNGNPAANQFVLDNANATYFQSYDSVVAKVDKNGLTLSDYWDYSNTTRKHLYIFLKDMGYGHLDSAARVRKAIERGEVALVHKSSLTIK